MIRLATDSDRDAVVSLFEACFPDEGGFNPYFFEHFYRPEHTLLLFAADKLCAMTQMLPYTLGTGETATYIYGACTAPDERKRGHMARLLRHSFTLDREAGRAASMLIPQEPWLFGFYERFGYARVFYAQDVCYTAQACGTDGEARRLKADGLAACAALYAAHTPSGALRRAPDEWTRQLALFDALGAGLYGLFRQGTLTAYAFVWRGETPWAQELIAASAADADALCAAICRTLRCRTLKATSPGEDYALGMANFYDDRHAPRGYMNLMLN